MAYKVHRIPSSLTPMRSSPEGQHLDTSIQNAGKLPDVHQLEHPLLDARLVGASLKVLVDDGETYKNRLVDVSIAEVEGDVCIRHIVYNTSRYLDPAWVTPKTPNPTRDNGI